MKSNLIKIILFAIIVCLFVAFIIGCKYNKQANDKPTLTVGNNNEQASNVSTTLDKLENKNDKINNDISTESSVIEDNEVDDENMESGIGISTESKAESKIDNQTLIDLGEFKLTAYCSCKKCCGKWALNRPVDENGKEIVYGASGERLIAGVSVAVDPKVIPYGTELIINGHTYIAHDTGGAIKGNHLDVYHNNHQEAWNFGLQYANVYKVVK